MVNIIRASGAASHILAEVAPAEVPELISKPSGTLITTDISFLKPSVAYKEVCFRVPLTTIMPKHLNPWNRLIGQLLADTQLWLQHKV